MAEIRNALGATLSADANQRQQAEAFLNSAQSQPGYAPTLMQLLSSPPSPEEGPLFLAAAVNFKNFIKSRWISKDERGHNTERDLTVESGLSESDRNGVKESLLPLALTHASSGSPVSKQLTAALLIMAEADFPEQWPSLLPTIMASLSDAITSNDTSKMLAALKLVDVLFRRFRSSSRSESELVNQMRYCLEQTNEPLLALLNSVSAPVQQARTANTALNNDQATALVGPVRALGRLFSIFYSLTYLILPEFYDDHLAEWMSALRMALSFPSGLVGDQSPLAVHQSGSDSRPGPLLKIQAQACASLGIFVMKHEDEFLPYLPDFVQDIWGLLTNLPVHEEKYDALAVAAIDFLSQVASSVHYGLFGQGDALNIVLSHIVLPSVKPRESDEELFEDDHVEYIRRDIEGSDADTRRKAACDLIRSLRRHFEETVTQLCSTHINSLLAAGDWRSKDAAFYLIIALAVSASTKAAGASQINSLVPLLEFFQSQAMPLLAAGPVGAGAGDDKTGQLILQADALKFATIFRSMLPDEVHQQLVPLAAALLASEGSYVVRAYAAHFLERLLALRTPNPTSPTALGPYRLPSQSVDQLVGQLATGVFKAMALGPPRSAYMARCLMRLVARATGAGLLPHAEFMMTQVNGQLEGLAANPGAPDFTHCLFETTAALIGGCARHQPQTTASFEGGLFPLFQKILGANVVELSPYVFQLLAMLLELSPGGSGELSPAYKSLLPPLLDPVVWQSKGNVPGLVRLLQAYMRRGASDLVDQLPKLIEIFGRLVRNRHTDHEGFYLLEGVVQYLPFAAFQPHLGNAFQLIFARLTAHKTGKMVNSFDIWLALLLSKHDPDAVVSTIDTMQPRLFGMVLESLWLPHLQTVKGTIEKKMCAIASVRLLAQCQALRAADGYGPLFGALLTALVKLFELPTQDKADELDQLLPGDDGFGGGGGPGGYSASFNKLRCAVTASVDPFPDVSSGSLPSLLATQLHEASKQSPGVFPNLVATANDPAVQQAINNYFQMANIPSPFLN